MEKDFNHRGRAAWRWAVLAAALLAVLTGCSSLTDLLPGLTPTLEFVEPRAGSTVTVGSSVPVRVDTSAVSAPLDSVHLEVDGEWVGALSDGDGDGNYTGWFTANQVGRFRLSAVGVGEDGRVRSGAVDLVGEGMSRFTIIAVPDTQSMIEEPGNRMVEQMMEWIAAQREELSIAFVATLGDVVENGSVLAEWQRADAAYDRLDGAVPYSVTLGDHDYAKEGDKASSTANYLQYFGPGRYSNYSWYRGSGPGGLNHYQIFEAGGRRFLHISLEWEPAGPASDPSTPLGWARSVIEANPDLPTIISTHAYLWDKPGEEGRTPASALEGYLGDPSVPSPGTSGEGMFEALVEPYPQVFMVLNGGLHYAHGTDSLGEYHQVSLNSGGLPVYEMLSDYQDYPEGSQSYLRIIEFVPGGGAGGLDRISVRTYSPVRDQYLTDASSQFQFDLSFTDRWALD